MAIDKYGVEVTPERWEKVDLAIKDFIRRYPLQWTQFQRELSANRTQYQLASEGELRKSSFRNTLSFPVVARPRTEAEKAEDPAHSPVEFIESIKVTLDALLPGFTDPDENVEKSKSAKDIKPNKLYREFIHRYGRLFGPGEKI